MLRPFDKYLDLIQDLIPFDEEMVCDKRKTLEYNGTEYSTVSQIMIYNLLKKSASDNSKQ